MCLNKLLLKEAHHKQENTLPDKYYKTKGQQTVININNSIGRNKSTADKNLQVIEMQEFSLDMRSRCLLVFWFENSFQF